MTLPTRQKIGLFCNVPTERVLSLYDVPTIYRVPLEMLERSTPHGAPTEPRASHRGLAPRTSRQAPRQAGRACPAPLLLTRLGRASGRSRHSHLRAARPHLLPRTAAQRSGRGGAGRRGVSSRDGSASGRGDLGCPAAAAARRALCRGVGSHGTLALALALSLALRAALTLAVSPILTLPPTQAWAAMARKMEGADGGGGALPEVVVALVGKYSAQADCRLSTPSPNPTPTPNPKPTPNPQPIPNPHPIPPTPTLPPTLTPPPNPHPAPTPNQADSYLSVQSSLTHACVAAGSTVRVEVVDSELLGSGDAESWRRGPHRAPTPA